ncbi:MAG: hypothetical protein AAF570_23265, partial [Bacteroidota bacterium]
YTGGKLYGEYKYGYREDGKMLWDSTHEVQFNFKGKSLYKHRKQRQERILMVDAENITGITETTFDENGHTVNEKFWQMVDGEKKLNMELRNSRTHYE